MSWTNWFGLRFICLTQTRRCWSFVHSQQSMEYYYRIYTVALSPSLSMHQPQCTYIVYVYDGNAGDVRPFAIGQWNETSIHTHIAHTQTKFTQKLCKQFNHISVAKLFFVVPSISCWIVVGGLYNSFQLVCVTGRTQFVLFYMFRLCRVYCGDVFWLTRWLILCSPHHRRTKRHLPMAIDVQHIWLVCHADEHTTTTNRIELPKKS